MSFFYDHTLQTGWQPDGRWYPNSPLIAPDGYKFDTYPGRGAPYSATAITLTTQVIQLTAIVLPSNVALTKIAVMMGSTAAATITNSWMVLLGTDGKVLGVTANNTSVPTASALWSQNFSASFSTPYAGLYYLGVMFKATTLPTLTGFTSTSALNGVAPILCGTGSGAQTTPPAVGTLLAVPTTGTSFFYGCVG